ncbi:U-box domain-containing protein 5-like isoform X1 [Corylus avellana]|uniref:U-box domain-containing protein 5-like isoform X1 n=2 Tax=Corylus avellana TaxID=13451 RepID=UPI001E21BF26|nr:U-box domain-containing protein 5-like isoform X1 [Corylus avellana]
MGSGVVEVVGKLPDPFSYQVPFLMCRELLKSVNRISKILPSIEAARPQGSSGKKALCLLNEAIEKAKQFLKSCRESSKLYLIVTAKDRVSRCQKLKNFLEQSLGELHTMVQPELAQEISCIMDDLGSATFTLDSSEEAAAKAMEGLIFQRPASGPMEKSEVCKTLQLAASTLHVTSPKAIWIEKESIKKKLDEVGDSDPKKKILRYLLDILRKYENSILQEESHNDSAQNEGEIAFENGRSSSAYGVDILSRATPPEDFRCPISSRLMYDPVVIASGQTYERMFIRKWFEEGNDTCPKTKMKLDHLSLTPNTDMKDSISNWCMKYGVTITDPTMLPAEALPSWETSFTSFTTFGSSMNGLPLRTDVSNGSLGSLDTSYTSSPSQTKIADGLNLISTQTKEGHKLQSYENTREMDSEFLSKLAERQWESQCKVVEDIRKHLNNSEKACHHMSAANFVEPLVKFLKDAHGLRDVKAQKAGSQLLLAFLSKNRSGISYLREEAFSLLATYIDSEAAEEALDIVEVLSGHRYCRAKIAASGALTSILKILDSSNKIFQKRAIKILCNLSSTNEVCSHIVSLQCIPKLVPFLVDSALAGNCVYLLKNLCCVEEARISVAETNGCIAAVAELLATGTHVDQENAVAVLLSLCSHHAQYCQLLMDERFTAALDDISVNGNEKGKVSALELLRLLKDHQQCPFDASRRDPPDLSKERKSSKGSRFFGWMSSKPTSATGKKK